ncbi:hypothetical protein BHL53_01160 [Bacillus cereus]|uniref:Uncharacterized protein n=1 Tax=Bacillus cereus TaxID=1396 RepID=A0A5E9V2S6_BACCE|nr:hypothetical protein BHL53_01160 [Bacillus cereus]PNK33365.1 hypothetical protein CBP87_01275 [Bacillus thuringiensis]QEF18727.1 hypothetical protein FRY47_20895 [Bacillus cereus]TEX18650.1 hypothetical protein E2F98_03500 [Bacillus cereus]
MYIDFIFCPLNRHLLIVIITKDATLFNKKTFCSSYYEEQNVTFAFTYKYLFSPTALQSISRLSLQVPLHVT